MKKLIILLSCFVICSATNAYTYNQSKKYLPRVYSGQTVDYYCGCHYSGKVMDLESCGYRVRKNEKRASKLEWEHVVPAWVIGHQRQCWQNGGRKNCTANDPVFNQAEGDMVNFVPSVGEVNGDRSNYSFSEWTKNPQPMYGSCKTIIDFKGRKIQPREEIRGEIARIYFHMHDKYNLNMSNQDKRLFCAWSKLHPVSDWERERNRRIISMQGFGNEFVSNSEKLKRHCN